jgi:hypothetical protein
MSRRLSKPARQVWVLARLSRAPERSVQKYVSTGAQRKRSQDPKSAGVLTSLRYRGWPERASVLGALPVP